MFKHWRAWLGGLFFVQPVLEFGKWFLDWAGRFDLIASHLHDFGMQAMLDFFLHPPPSVLLPSIFIGLLFVWWDAKRKDSAELDLNQTLLIGFYAGCATVCIGVWSMWWYVTSPVTAAPTPAIAPAPIAAPTPISPPPRVTQATPERVVYKCKRSPAAEAKTEDARFAEFKKYIEVYSDMNGYAAKVTAVPGGRKAELTPATPFGVKNMGNALKMSVEVRTIGKDLLGIFTAEYSANVWAGYLLPEGSETETRIHKRIEDLVGADPGNCELQ